MKIEMRLIIFPILLLIAALIFTAARVVYNQQQELSHKLIRLRVVANSDSEYDQNLKLYVRDSVNTCLSEILSDCTNRESAIQAIRENSDIIKSAAENSVRSFGSAHPVNISFQDEYFPTRQYDTFTLPAGEYMSLQIRIGNAEGQNWWCVVFPPLCSELATAETMTEMDFTDHEIEFITSEDNEVVLKFRFLEYISAVKQLLEDI